MSASSSAPTSAQAYDWWSIVPFAAVHLGCLAVFWVGVGWFAVTVACCLYLIRMFAVTAFYHRYFSHRTFRTHRWCQFLFGFLGATAAQRGPLWWAAHHRGHHRHSDKPADPHSPRGGRFWWSHCVWFLTKDAAVSRNSEVGDLAKFPELVLLDRYAAVPPLLLAGGLYGLGAYLAVAAPSIGTTGPQLLVWGFCLSTVALYHATYTINSLAHRFGRVVYDTGDDSKNNGWLALVTLGEGWHNNHHRYPNSVRQGFFWWEFDLSFYVLWIMSRLGLVWGMRPVPQKVLDERQSGPLGARERGSARGPTFAPPAIETGGA